MILRENVFAEFVLNTTLETGRFDYSTTELRPSVINRSLWYPDRPPQSEWKRLREEILKRDDYICHFCNHRALKWMNIHHFAPTLYLPKSDDDLKGGYPVDGEKGIWAKPITNEPSHLTTLCIACHAVLHIGYNLTNEVIEIWESDLSQLQVIQYTRKEIANGKSLAEIKKAFHLKKGRYSPESTEYANDLIHQMGNLPMISLEKPLCAIFVNLQRWQIEGN